MSQLIFLIFMAFLLLVLSFVLYLSFQFAWAAWRRNQALIRHGVETEAEVIDRYTKRGRRGAQFYYIVYRYRAPSPQGEQEFIGVEQVWFFEYDRCHIGSKLTVCYLPDSPNAALRTQKVIGRQ